MYFTNDLVVYGTWHRWGLELNSYREGGVHINRVLKLRYIDEVE